MMSKERLVELILQTETYSPDQEEYARKWAEYKAIYLLKNGVVAPLLKIADRIYQTDGVRIYKSSIHEIIQTASKIVYVTESIVFDETAIGKSIFLTREEAEAKLKNEQ